MLKIVLAAAAAATLIAGSACAQSDAPPMDMTWAIRSQTFVDRLPDAKGDAADRAQIRAVRVTARESKQAIKRSVAARRGVETCNGDAWSSASRPIGGSTPGQDDDLAPPRTRDCARVQRDQYGFVFYAC